MDTEMTEFRKTASWYPLHCKKKNLEVFELLKYDWKEQEPDFLKN